jgi:hypothetical protein
MSKWGLVLGLALPLVAQAQVVWLGWIGIWWARGRRCWCLARCT